MDLWFLIMTILGPLPASLTLSSRVTLSQIKGYIALVIRRKVFIKAPFAKTAPLASQLIQTQPYACSAH
jgi:hypothetical protein